ncbi:hypothetical protein [Alteribacter natronophilus]|uniref:hypothetical protein n=1 Tax=Alteribacter natronophilus TaxID=2583810 RepID=UPI00110EEA39|nr:hypothetical protein [Alteribacter natronophilus]TMW72244.1 hypothetical protein FGB90_08515 [Alteribacter natronophilus]
MSIESKVNSYLSKFPLVKKVVKRVYQYSMYAVSKKVKYEGDIHRVTPDDEYEYFFGYYDKSPWDATGRYMLCLRVNDTTKSVAPSEPADIILIDTENQNKIKVIGQTNTWNVQQGCMLQWLAPDHKNCIIYNDFRNNEFCSIIYDLNSKKEAIIPKPVYSVSQDGKTAVTLDFARLHRMRPGYGYSNKTDSTNGNMCPDATCIWSIDLINGKIKSILKYTDFYHFEHREEMKNAEHKVNHLMLNPSGDRFIVLHRWYVGSKKYTRLVSVNVDGTDMCNLLDDGMVSHCNWKNDKEIIAYAYTIENGNGYYSIEDQTQNIHQLWPELKNDGHPSYSADGKKVVTDTYPDRARVCKLYLMDDKKSQIIAKVFAPFKYDNDFRCDLHPRWNRSGSKVCFDSVFEGQRSLYLVYTDMRDKK